jgi:hypothetical protein
MNDRELLEQALRAFLHYDHDKKFAVIDAISARLAENNDGEPVAYLLPRHGIRVNCDIVPKEGEPEVPLYLRPQPKARLTEEEIEEVYMRFPTTPYLFARAIEEKIWEKTP